MDILTNYDDYLSPSEFEMSVSNSSQKKAEGEAEADTLSLDSILEEEECEVGTIQLNVYMSYLKAVGYILTIAIFLSLILMQASRNLTDWWLSYWASTFF